MKHINRAKEKFREAPNTDSHERSVLEKLLSIDEQTAHVMALDMLTAGVDTVSDWTIRWSVRRNGVRTSRDAFPKREDPDSPPIAERACPRDPLAMEDSTRRFAFPTDLGIQTSRQLVGRPPRESQRLLSGGGMETHVLHKSVTARARR